MGLVFEEPAESTFPSQRYGSMCLCQSELVSPSHTEGTRRIATLDVRHYRPEEINLKVESGEILVEGKHYCKREFGHDASEFRRRYSLPQNCSAESIGSRISQDGVLTIEASSQNATSTSCASERVVSNGKHYTIIQDMSAFSPEEVNVQTVPGGLRVSARHESRAGAHYYTSQRFDRHFVLPSDVDPATVMTSWSGNATLHLKATRKEPDTKGDSKK